MTVLFEVVEFPLVAGDHVGRRPGTRLPRKVGRGRRRHPAVMVDGAIAQHLEILRGVPGGRIGIGLVPRIDHAHTLDRPLLDAVNCVGCRDAGCLKDCRHNIYDMMKLMTNAAHVLDMAGP